MRQSQNTVWARAIPAGRRRLSLFLFFCLSACGLVKCAPKPLNSDEIAALYAAPVAVPDAPLAVYHIGHSLVGRDMLAMLKQLADASVGEGHSYHTQTGSGVELEAHWEPDIPIKDGAKANDHPQFREAHDAVASGEYDALVLTEKIGIEASIKYHDAWRYLTLWTQKAQAANPDIRVYMYETWHGRKIDNWLERLDQDLPKFWEREILDRAMADDRITPPIYVIPAGQVFAALERRLAEGPIAEIAVSDVFFRDAIHLSDAGNYLVALIHYAVLYGQPPAGLPHALRRADDSPATPLSAQAVGMLQDIVWQVVTEYPRTGVRP